MNDPVDPIEPENARSPAPNGTPGEVPDDAVASRTQRKREALDLQKMGERLVNLDSRDLATVPLTPELEEAIGLWRRIRSHEAKRRQLQFIGKLMRRIDLEPIADALNRIDGSSAEARYAFHQLETWRDRLIAEKGALTEYLSGHPQADRQALRHQIARVHKASDDAQRRNQSRALFRMLRDFEDLAE